MRLLPPALSPVLPTVVRGDRGLPTVVLLHGMLGSAEYWREFSALMPNHRVVAVDLLGFGRAPRPSTADYDYADHCSAVLRTLESLGIVEPITLVGHSMGALIALRMAAEWPERFNRLVVVGMPVFDSAALAHAAIANTPLRRALLYGPLSRAICLTWCHMLRPISRRLAPYYLRRIPVAVARATVDHSWRSYSRSLVNIVEHQAVTSDLRRTTCPVLVVYGTEDRDASAAEEWSGRPGMTVVALPGGHQLPLERPGEIVDLVLSSTVGCPEITTDGT